MSAVLCLPACLCVSPQRPVARPPHGKASLPRVTLSPLSSQPYPRPMSLVRPPYWCSPSPCVRRCSSPRQGCISRALTRLSDCDRSSVVKADMGGLPWYAVGGISPLSASAGLPSISSLIVGWGGRYGSMRVIGMASFCGRCGAPVCRCSPPAPLPRRAAVSCVRARSFPFVPLVPRSSPFTRVLRVSPAPRFSTLALPPLTLSLCHVLSPLPTTSPCPNPASHGGASLALRRLYITVCYHCLCCTPSRVVHSWVPPMPPMPLEFPLVSGRTRRPLALAHQCGCAPCGTTSPCGPRSLRLSTSQAGRGRALRAPATRQPNGTSAAPPRWSLGSGQSASQGGQPYRGAIMQSPGTDCENAG